MIDIKELLRTLVESGGSDLHLKVGAPPIIRVDGDMRRLDTQPLTQDDTERVAQVVMPIERREKLADQKEADFGYVAPGTGRFRVNVFHQRGSMSLVFRRVRIGIQNFAELGLPPVLETFSEHQRGLVIVAGPTGTGKTTTLACMIDHINATKACHILTIEDPIEVVHRDRVATVNQREIGWDTDNYANALRAAMRQDPDVIFIGECRDMETAAAALSAAETGHLVLTTLHTTNAVETVNRMVDFFPSYSHHQVRVALGSSLIGVVCQRLVHCQDGGRVPAVEVMVNNGRVAERIVDSKRTPEIHDIIEHGESWGMQSFDRSLLELVRQGRVSVADAYPVSSNPHDFHLMLVQSGLIPPTDVEARPRRRDAIAG